MEIVALGLPCLMPHAKRAKLTCPCNNDPICRQGTPRDPRTVDNHLKKGAAARKNLAAVVHDVPYEEVRKRTIICTNLYSQPTNHCTN